MIRVSRRNQAGIRRLGVILGVMLLMLAPWGAPRGFLRAEDAAVFTTVSRCTTERRFTTETRSATEIPFVTETLRGRVVWMAEALQRRFGIQSVSEASERILAVETEQGELHPLVEDMRGRAFRRDRRLRDLKDAEFFVRRFHGSPMIQIIRLYTHEDGTRYELDYWCDICAITMFELKACDCCQGDIELRRRKSP